MTTVCTGEGLSITSNSMRHLPPLLLPQTPNDFCLAYCHQVIQIIPLCCEQTSLCSRATSFHVSKNQPSERLIGSIRTSIFQRDYFIGNPKWQWSKLISTFGAIHSYELKCIPRFFTKSALKV